MIWFSEIDKDDILFQFYDRELPEDISFSNKAKLNKIEYVGGHQTNQIIGVYRDTVEWSGVFFGSYVDDNGSNIFAKIRADRLDDLIGKPVRVGFPVGGQGPMPGVDSKTVGKVDKYSGGYKGVYIIEEFTQKVKNYLHVEYTIKLAPHERQEKIRPDKTTDVRVGVSQKNLSSATAGLAKAANKSGGKPVLDKSKGIALKNDATAGGMKAPDIFKTLSETDSKNELLNSSTKLKK